jgi:hypothetical protein
MSDQSLRYVAQEHACSCGPACLAMVTGKPYREVCDEFPGKQWNNAREVLSHFEMDIVLAAWGYAVARRFCGGSNQWMPQPLGPYAHICLVETPMGGHWVVMLPDGGVLDPASGPALRQLADYQAVSHVAAVVPLRGHVHG